MKVTDANISRLLTSARYPEEINQLAYFREHATITTNVQGHALVYVVTALCCELCDCL